MTVHIPAPEDPSDKPARTRIEFRHQLQDDKELPTVRHLVNLFDENRKPIPTADNLPDKKEEYDVTLKGDDVKNSNTILDLYNIVSSKL